MELRSEEIQRITEGYLPDDSFFVVDVKLTGKRGNEKVVILVDGDEGISVDTCADISRSVSEELESLNMFEESYTLEVSSPGLDFPLTSERQYNKNIGRQLKIDLISGERVKGDLIRTDNSGITLKINTGKEKEDEDLFIPFSNIKSSKVLVAFK
ncbi:MAG: ribosome maturation factor RimP [Cyclobacteriaceae bacterium]